MFLLPLGSSLPTVTLRRQARRIGKSSFGELARALKPLRRCWEIFSLSETLPNMNVAQTVR